MRENLRLGDRRGEIRFELIGDLWGTLAVAQSMPLVNIGPGGVLVESASPLAVGSSQWVRLTLGDDVNDLATTVRHVAPAPGKLARYLVGLAFEALPAETLERIEALVDRTRVTVPGDVEA